MVVITNSKLVQLANKLIPKPLNVVTTVNENGKTIDIVNAIVSADKKNKQGTENFAPCLKNSQSTITTLKNVYWFVKRNINYKVDGFSMQAIKSPQAIWHMRIGDCKSYALFISSILKNLGIVHQYKFAGYSAGSYNVTHIYIIVPQADGNYLVLDPCMPSFNKEKIPITSLLKNPT